MSYRLRKAHARFLESCRNLKEGRRFWEADGAFKRWVLQLLVPVPLLGLHADGQRILAALDWLEANAARRKLDLDVLRQYHRLLFPGDPDRGWRRQAVTIEGGSVPLPPPHKLPALLQQFEARVLRDQEDLDRARDPEAVLSAAASAYHRVGFIHPYPDGNGRLARLALNHLLRRYGEGYCVLPPLSEAGDLLTALEEYGHGRTDPLLEKIRRSRVPI